jgi:hypothetical protein
MPDPLARPLVRRDQWLVSGEFFQNARPGYMEVREDIRTSPEAVFWRSWSPETGQTSGILTSASFRPPRFLVVPLHGFPLDPAIQVYLECSSDGRRRTLAQANTNTQWSQVQLFLPRGWCGDKVRLVAATSSQTRYIAVGTPFKISVLSFLKGHPVGRLAEHAAIFGVYFVVGFAGAVLLRRRGVKAPVWLLELATLGVTSYVVFFLLWADWPSGYLFVLLGVLTALALVLWYFMRETVFVMALFREARAEHVAWFVGSLGYVLLLHSVDSGGGSWMANLRFAPAGWSSDNQLPVFVTEVLVQGGDVRNAFGGGDRRDWQVSDRPPLMSGFLALARCFLPTLYGNDRGWYLLQHSYPVAAILVNSLWLPCVCLLLRRILTHGAVALVLLICALTPFAIFNSIYGWPKLLSGALGIAALTALWEFGPKVAPVKAIAGAGLFGALALLSHGGIAFGVLPVAALVVRMRGLRALKEAVPAVMLVVGLLAPWLLWQRYVDPPGNALIKYALAGTFGFSEKHVSVMETVARAYSSIGLETWLHMRLLGLLAVLGVKSNCGLSEVWTLGSNISWVDIRRGRDFAQLIPSLNFLVLGLLGLMPWFGRTLTPTASRSVAVGREALLIGGAGVALNLVLTWDCHIVHHQSYLSLLLVLLGLVLITEGLPVPAATGLRLAAVAYSGVIWIVDPLWDAERTSAFAILAFLGLLLTVATLIVPASGHGRPTVAIRESP